MSFAIEMLAVVVDPFLDAMHIERRDDDVLDKLNHKVSTGVTFLLLFVHTFYQIFLSQVINCWTPSQFSESWVDYTNAYCWTKNTYYIPPQQENILDTERRVIVYYQWVPYILAYIGILSYLPGLLWYVGSPVIGLSVEDMVHNVRRIRVAVRPSEIDRHSRAVASHIDRALTLSHISAEDNSNRHVLCDKCRCNVGCTCTILNGRKLTLVWVTTKIMYICSSAAQVYSLYIFMGYDYLLYGVHCIADLYKYGGPVFELSMFPRVTICDFEVRSIGKNVPYTVQCNLPINIFNAKIFLILWYWIALVAILNVVVFVGQVFAFTPRSRYKYIKHQLLSLDVYNPYKEKPLLKSFVTSYLKCDGYLTMKLMSCNANPLVAAGVIRQLWGIHCSNVWSKKNNIAPSPLPSKKRMQVINQLD